MKIFNYNNKPMTKNFLLVKSFFDSDLIKLKLPLPMFAGHEEALKNMLE